MSRQLARYLSLRASGASIESAAHQSGIGLVEARLTEKAVEKGEVEMPHAGAPARAREDDQSGEGTSMDAQTTMSINGGPAIPLNLNDVDAPENAEAKAAIAESIGRTIDGNTQTATAQKLRLFVERVERLDEEIKGLNEDKSDVFQEMKSDGFDTKTVKTIIKLRKMDSHARQEAAALLETYANALGLQGALPL